MDFLIVKSQYLYAKNSLEIKQEDRYNEAVEEYERFVEKYPKSAFLKEAEELKNNSLKGIEEVKKLLAQYSGIKTENKEDEQ